MKIETNKNRVLNKMNHVLKIVEHYDESKRQGIKVWEDIKNEKKNATSLKKKKAKMSKSQRLIDILKSYKVIWFTYANSWKNMKL